MTKVPRIVLLGGGTGSFALLQGLKQLTPNLTAIVNMSDDGGSSGTLRDELGVLPPGDVRQCLVALSGLREARDLFDYRFSVGRLEGQSLGNIIISGLDLQYGNFEEAIRVAGELLHVCGKVVPVTLEKHTLMADDNGTIYRGEHVLDGSIRLSSEARVYLDPQAHINPVAAEAIKAADLVVIAPGSLYTTLMPLLAVSGVPEAIASSHGKVVWVANLVNKPLQNDDWHIVDYVKHLESRLGEGVIDVVLYNTEPITASLLDRYAADGELSVDNASARFEEIGAEAIGTRLVAADVAAQDPADTAIRRTLIRHDGAAVAEELRKLLTA